MTPPRASPWPRTRDPPSRTRPRGQPVPARRPRADLPDVPRHRADDRPGRPADERRVRRHPGADEPVRPRGRLPDRRPRPRGPDVPRRRSTPTTRPTATRRRTTWSLQEPLIQQVLEAMRIPFLSRARVRGRRRHGDGRRREAAARGLDVFLCTADKDCRQLLTDKVKILNLRKEARSLDAAGLLADWGVAPGSGDRLPGARRRLGGQRPRRAGRRAEDGGEVAAAVRHARQPHRPRRTRCPAGRR